MIPKILLRIAAVLLFLFAAGHTSGHLGRKNTADPRAQALIREMEDYHFDFKGATQTLDGHMEGYGIMTTFILVSLGLLLWVVSTHFQAAPSYSKNILFAVIVFMTGNAYVAFRYFFLGPAIASGLVIVLLITAAILMKEHKNVVQIKR